MGNRNVRDNSKSIYDTIVIGNGALGLAIGLELSKKGQRVAVVGPKSREGGASTAAGAMNGCFGEVTSDLLLNPYGRAKFEHSFNATMLWDDWLTEIISLTDIPYNNLRQKTGTTVILNSIGTNAIDSENFSAIKCALEEYKQAYSILDENEIRWISAQESSRPFQAIHIPNEHSIVTPNYLLALELAFIRLSGQIVDGSVCGLDNSTSLSMLKLTNGIELAADNIVLAAGAFSSELLGSFLPDIAKLVPPMVSGCGTSVLIDLPITRPLSGVIRTPNRAFACGLHALPQGDKIYIGATNILSNKPQALGTVSDFHFLLECAMKQLHSNISFGRISRLQFGNRPVTVDGFPLIGKLDGTNIWMATGNYRDGLHTSPLLAKSLAQNIVNREIDPLSIMFSPMRPPIQTATRKEIISATVEHAFATGCEADWRIPVKWSVRIKRDLETKYSFVAEELHYKFTPPPELLAFAAENVWFKTKLVSFYKNYS